VFGEGSRMLNLEFVARRGIADPEALGLLQPVLVGQVVEAVAFIYGSFHSLLYQSGNGFLVVAPRRLKYYTTANHRRQGLQQLQCSTECNTRR